MRSKENYERKEQPSPFATSTKLHQNMMNTQLGENLKICDTVTDGGLNENLDN